MWPFKPQLKPGEVQITGYSDAELNKAAIYFIDAHYRYSAPFETFSMKRFSVNCNNQPIGDYEILVRRIDIC